MVDQKRGISPDRIQNYLGQQLTVDLKNHHTIIGTLVFYHLTEQMIHMIDWTEYDTDHTTVIKKGKYMVINRTAWFQLYKK